MVAVVLASGFSKRMGRPKALLPWKNGVLLEHTLQQLIETGVKRVYYVYQDPAIEKQMASSGLACVSIFNPEAHQGKSASIAAAIDFLESEGVDYEAVLFAVCDQPLLDHHDYIALLELFQNSNSSVAAAAYAGTFGVPMVVERAALSEIHKLSGDQGMKEIVRRSALTVAQLDVQEKGADVDDPKTYQSLYAQFGKE